VYRPEGNERGGVRTAFSSVLTRGLYQAFTCRALLPVWKYRLAERKRRGVRIARLTVLIQVLVEYQAFAADGMGTDVRKRPAESERGGIRLAFLEVLMLGLIFNHAFAFDDLGTTDLRISGG
jgi:hypothetical protein